MFASSEVRLDNARKSHPCRRSGQEANKLLHVRSSEGLPLQLVELGGVLAQQLSDLPLLPRGEPQAEAPFFAIRFWLNPQTGSPCTQVVVFSCHVRIFAQSGGRPGALR